MKLKMLGALLVLVSVGAQASTHVQGYTRKDGTYVQPHFKSEPSRLKSDNYSASGNTNPYTGERGSKNHEYTSTPSYNKNYNNLDYGKGGRAR